MTIMGQLQSGVVQVVKPGTNQVIGHAFTVEDGNGGQLQRWLLKENPQNSMDIQPAPDMSGMSLTKWREKVSKEWTPSSIYVWAQADVYIYGNIYNGVKWTNIPPASALPKASFPPVNAGHYQLEYNCGGSLKVQQDGSNGLVFTLGTLLDETSVEYWMLPPSYQAAGVGASAAITGGVSSLATCAAGATTTDPAVALQQFIDLANKSWTDRSRFVITGCVNHHGPIAPGTP